MMSLLFILSCILLIYYAELVQSLRPLESYSESLLVRRLDNDTIGLRFEFISRKVFDDPFAVKVGGRGAVDQYETFPKIIKQVITENITDLRLVMTRGTWSWGSETLWPSIESGAPGVELWANVTDHQRNWAPLVRALAGMTCASLDGLQQTSAHGRLDNGAVFATMPSETVCTENISPWLKLLPCRNRAGLGRLLAPKMIIDSKYYALALTTSRTDFGMELIQSMSIVLPIEDSLSATLGETFSSEAFTNVCGVASSSTILVHSPTRGEEDRLRPSPNQVTNDYVLYNLPLAHEEGGGDVKGLLSLPVAQPSRHLRTVRWRSGWGDLRGTISTALYNDDSHANLSVYHIEFIPSFLRLRLDTLKIYVGNTLLNEEETRKIVRIISTVLRGPPTTVELKLVIPKGGKRVLVTYDFDKAFMFFDEFPPNPNRGFDVPSATTSYNRTTIVDFNSKKHPGIWMRSTTGPIRTASKALLVSLPQPDFSMPYNVITLSSTGFALFFGMFVNVSVRGRGDRWVVKSKSRAKSLFERLRMVNRRCARGQPSDKVD